MTTNSMALMALSSFGVGIIVALVTAIIVAPLSIFIVSFIYFIIELIYNINVYEKE